jgi:hypothetical protein
VQTGTFRVRLANTQNTLLAVTGGASTTTWTVVAEANDANCPLGPNAVFGGEITAGGMRALLAVHSEPLTDGNDDFIFAGGDIVVVTQVPN